MTTKTPETERKSSARLCNIASYSGDISATLWIIGDTDTSDVCMCIEVRVVHAEWRHKKFNIFLNLRGVVHHFKLDVVKTQSFKAGKCLMRGTHKPSRLAIPTSKVTSPFAKLQGKAEVRTESLRGVIPGMEQIYWNEKYRRGAQSRYVL